MSAWDVADVATALPTGDAVTSADPIERKNPQEHGWAPKTSYDYETYNKTTKELAADRAANAEDDIEDLAELRPGEWASNAATYVWSDEFGDVGPRFPALEEQLFGLSANRSHTGINFEKITSIEVSQEGAIRLEPCRTFEQAGLHPVMLENVKMAGYTIPTPIQQYCLPAIFKGYDIVACAQTGSGKTAAFLIPILSKLMGKAKKLAAGRPNPATFQPGITPPVRAEPLVLVVCPNRELATQIFDEARRFCYRSMLRPCVLYGGGPVAEQLAQISKGCDVLIGTPGRLKDFIVNKSHVLTLRRLKYMVIDEADEMLQSDWEEELSPIMSNGDQDEGNIRYMLFSATFPKVARDLARQHLAHDHVRIRVGRAGSSHVNIRQDIIYVEPSAKREALMDLLLSAPPARTIIFVNSKRTVDELDDFLFNRDMPCTAIHSNRTQREREDSIRAFRVGKAPILIATGVSARGLDIGNVMHVVNYDLPSIQYGGIEEYTHRIGRTGRIGNMGLATSFYNDRDSDIAETLVKTLLETHQSIPDFLEEHIPEGFTADGQGDTAKLKFEADSDDEEAEENVEAKGWGDTGAPGWDAPEEVAAEPAGINLGAPSGIPLQASGSGWSQPAHSTPQASRNGRVNPVQGAPPVEGSAWGPPPRAVQTTTLTRPAAPAASDNNGWGVPTQPTAVLAEPASVGWSVPDQQAAMIQSKRLQSSALPVQLSRPITTAPKAQTVVDTAAYSNIGWNAPALRPSGQPAPTVQAAPAVQTAPVAQVAPAVSSSKGWDNGGGNSWNAGADAW